MKISVAPFFLTLSMLQLSYVYPGGLFTMGIPHTMLAAQVRAACNDKKDDDSKKLSPSLILVSDLPEAEKRRQEMIAYPNLFNFLKDAPHYKECTIIGLAVVSPFLDDDEKSAMLKFCHKVEIASTEKDKRFENAFFFKRHPEFFPFLLCLQRKKRSRELPELPRDILKIFIDLFEPSENS